MGALRANTTARAAFYGKPLFLNVLRTMPGTPQNNPGTPPGSRCVEYGTSIFFVLLLSVSIWIVFFLDVTYSDIIPDIHITGDPQELDLSNSELIMSPV